MERELVFRQWLRVWKPKNPKAVFNGGLWKEGTLTEYIRILKRIVNDLNIDDQHVKKNLFEYGESREYLIVYGKIINHDKFKSLEYFPTAKKALKRYLDFLYELK